MVKAYIADHPEEYALVKQAIEMQREVIKAGMSDHTEDQKPLFEIPQQLSGLLVFLLDEEEGVWLKSREGGNWFAKTFPVFAL